MLFHQSMWSPDCDDSTLVSASVNGDREAFGQIVSRYQALVASVAFLGYKTDMADAASARQRRLVRRFYGLLAATVLVSIGLVLA